MHSLFAKVFVAIWFALLLFGISLLLSERYLGDRELDIQRQWLHAHAQNAATAHELEGNQGIHHWMQQLRHQETHRLWLLDEQGRVVFPRRGMPAREAETLSLPLESGTVRHADGRFTLIAPIEGSSPARYLAMRIDLGRLQGLGRGARIVLALLSSMLVSLILAYLLSRPLRRLRAVVQQMAAGDLGIRSRIRGGDEIAMLAQDVDRMAERLQAMLEHRKQLLSDVSHELRSPLARLRVALELAEQGGDKDKALGRIGKEADELEALISQLLSLARLDADRQVLQRDEVDLGDLLGEIVHDAGFEAEARQRHVELVITDTVRVQADSLLLRSAIENVVRNGIRHTAEGTTVRIHLEREGELARIRICDQGEGVPEAALSHIFEPFTRLSEARDRHSGGHGLGLSISARIMAAHQGRITAVNQAEGGLCVWLDLPCHPQAV